MMNLLIVEVKPGNRDDSQIVEQMVEDLAKLTTFRRDLRPDGTAGNYEAAYFWIYGIDADRWPALKGRLIQKSGARADVDLRLINCVLHMAAGQRARLVEW